MDMTPTPCACAQAPSSTSAPSHGERPSGGGLHVRNVEGISQAFIDAHEDVGTLNPATISTTTQPYVPVNGINLVIT